MPSTVAAVGIVGAVAVLTVGIAGVAAAATVAQRAAHAADSAALAAADAASGAVPGVPCEQAQRMADLGGATVTSCVLDELIATVSVSIPWGVWEAGASARAGPPE